jgi:hypothetical protein
VVVVTPRVGRWFLYQWLPVLLVDVMSEDTSVFDVCVS